MSTFIGLALAVLVVGCYAFLLARGSIVLTRRRCACNCGYAKDYDVAVRWPSQGPSVNFTAQPEPVLTATQLAAYRKHIKGEA